MLQPVHFLSGFQNLCQITSSFIKTLTASKDAGKPAIIAAVVTNPQWKESELFELVEVDESGNVKVFK